MNEKLLKIAHKQQNLEYLKKTKYYLAASTSGITKPDSR